MHLCHRLRYFTRYQNIPSYKIIFLFKGDSAVSGFIINSKGQIKNFTCKCSHLPDPFLLPVCIHLYDSVVHPVLITVILHFWSADQSPGNRGIHLFYGRSHRRCSIKKVLLKIPQNSQKTTYVGVSFLIRSKCFPVKFAKFLRIYIFYRAPPGG